MKIKIKVIIITILVLLLLILGLVFAVNKRNQSISFFSNSGYIIGNIYENNGEIETIHFENNSPYKKHSNDEFKITDVDGNKTIINEEMFVHYTDDSIMALKKGVAIDLNDIDSKLLRYYNISQEAVLQKTNEGYEIKNIDDIILFDKLMFKISENKYLIAADKIIAYFSEDQTINFKDFVEIEYVNENVIKIYNNENNYQSISSELYIMIDNIKIDLEYKTIEKNKVEYLTMADLNINSDDNIEILPEKEQEELNIEEDKTENNSNNNPITNNSTNNNGNGQQNSIDTSMLEGLTPITPDETEKEESVVKPKFTVENMDVDMLGLENLTMTMEDESGILYGNSTVKIIENSTGKEVATLSDWEEGNTKYSVNSYFGLKPNTEYTLTVTGKYEIEDTIYDRVYVSKIFRTLDIGIEILGDCATSDSLSFAIYKTQYSNVESISYDILDSNGKSVLNESKTLKYNTSDYVIASIDNLKSNSKYTLVIKNIEYGNDIISTDNVSSLKMTYTMKTLKQRPDLEVKLNADVNSLKNQITLNIENIKDINKGIKNYKYKIYLNDGTSFDTKEPVYVISKEDSSEVVVDIAKTLEQGNSYYFNVEIEFDDNEKTIIFDTEYSNPINTSEVVYPKIVDYVSVENVNCEELVGVLNISDDDGFIKLNNINEYQIVLREKGNSLSSDIADRYITMDGSLQNEYIALPVEFKKLKPNTEYVLYTYLKSKDKSIYIGYVTVKTTETDALYLVMNNIDDEESIDSNLFKFTMDLTDSYFDENDKNMNNIYEYIKNNLGYINLELRGCNGGQCIPLFFEKSVSNLNNSNELNDLLIGNTLSLNSSHFDFYAEDYRYDYKEYKLYIKAYSTTNYEIPIYINDQKENYFDLKIIDNIPTLEVKANEIVNMESNNELDYTTVVGYKLELKETYSTKNVGIEDFNYKIYEYAGDCQTVNESDLGDSIREGNLKLSDTFEKSHVIDIYFEEENEKKMYRGKKYCLIYNSTYKKDGTGDVKNTSSGVLELISNKQSTKIFGSLIKYQNNNITFKLKIDDIDSSVKSIYLKSEDNQTISLPIEESCRNKYCEYNFNISKLNKLTKFGLYIELEKSEGLQIENLLIYEFSLDEIKEINEPINLNITNENSKLIFTLDDLGLDIFGLKIISTDSDGTTKEKYLNIERKENISDENLEGTFKYEAIIDNSNLSDYGIKKQGYDIKLDNLNIQLIYSDGSIDLNSSDFVGIRQANLNLNSELYYYNNYPNKSLFENITSLNSIYYKESYKNIITNSQVVLKDLKYVGFDNSSNTIGQSLSSNLVHLYKISFKNLNFNKNDIVIDTVLATQNEFTYTTTGAYIDFNIVDSDIFGKLEKVNFNLNCGGTDESVEFIWNNNSNEWSYSDGTDHIEAINKKDNNIISVGIKNIDVYNNCTYNLKYQKTNEEELLMSINSENNQSNTGVITSLKNLSIEDATMEYETKYWEEKEINDNEIDLIFSKNLKYNFKILQNYILEENETLYYDVFISDDTEEISILEKQIINEMSISNIIDLYNYVSSGNTYKLIIKPYIVDENKNKTYILLNYIYENKFVVTEQRPEFSIVAYQDILYLNVKDNSGIFAPWNSEELSGYNLEDNNKKDTIYKNKKYYFEILDGDRILAYKPLSFITQTQSITLTNLFNNNILENRSYKGRICYYTILGEDKECTDPKEIKIMNSNTLNATIIQFNKSYLLDLDNPNLNVKDSMGTIIYTLLYNEGDVISETINDINFITRISSSGSASYFMELELPYGLTSDVKQLEVKILDKNGNEITTILYD